MSHGFIVIMAPTTSDRWLDDAAGAGVVKEAGAVKWGYYGYFSDPDGYLWKVATGA